MSPICVLTLRRQRAPLVVSPICVMPLTRQRAPPLLYVLMSPICVMALRRQRAPPLLYARNAWRRCYTLLYGIKTSASSAVALRCAFGTAVAPRSLLRIDAFEW